MGIIATYSGNRKAQSILSSHSELTDSFYFSWSSHVKKPHKWGLNKKVYKKSWYLPAKVPGWAKKDVGRLAFFGRIEGSPGATVVVVVAGTTGGST